VQHLEPELELEQIFVGSEQGYFAKALYWHLGQYDWALHWQSGVPSGLWANANTQHYPFSPHIPEQEPVVWSYLQDKKLKGIMLSVASIVSVIVEIWEFAIRRVDKSRYVRYSFITIIINYYKNQ
jgi:hypothetical protein